jgi:hypothetical protein
MALFGLFKSKKERELEKFSLEIKNPDSEINKLRNKFLQLQADGWALVRNNDRLIIERTMLATFFLTARTAGWRNAKLFKCNGDFNKDPDHLHLTACNFSDIEAKDLYIALKSQFINEFSADSGDIENKIKQTLDFFGKGGFRLEKL